MEEYNVLEARYQKDLFADRQSLTDAVKNNYQKLCRALESSPVTVALSEDQKEAFLDFLSFCNVFAAQTGGEISVSLDPNGKEADAVILTERLDTKGLSSLLAMASVCSSDRFTAEPVDENGLKIMLYFRYTLTKAVCATDA